MAGKECIFVPGCVPSEAPVSHAVKGKPFIFVSGQVGAELQTGKLKNESIESETIQALENVKQILAASGSSMENIVKVTVFLTDMSFFARVNEVYKRYFPSDRPARSCVQVGLAKNYRVEIEAIAIAQ